MIRVLKKVYGQTTLNGVFSPSAPWSGYGFETDTLSVVAISGVWNGALLEPKPADELWPVTVPVWVDCTLATAANEYEGVAYFHVLPVGPNMLGSTRTEPAPKSDVCGYVAPAAVCNLADAKAEVVGNTVTLSATGNRGPLRFSLDDALSTQSSAFFSRLKAGQYEATIIDSGTPNCVRKIGFTVLGADGALVDIPAPVGAPASLSLVLRPIWETIPGFVPGTLVRLELWVESQHMERDYACVYRAQKMADRNGVVSFQLDAMLRAQLHHEPLPGAAADTVFVRGAIRNYFCRTKTVDLVTDLERNPLNCPLRTMLLASLDKPNSFLSNQPNEKPLYPDQVEHLYWLSGRKATNTVTVRRAVQLSNGLSSVTTEQIDLTQGGAARYRLLAVPVLPGGILPARVVRVEVRLFDGNDQAMTDVRVYIVRQPVGHVTVRQFSWSNPFGGLDTLVTTGPGSKTLEVKTETAERAELPGEGVRAAQAWHWSFDEQRRQRVATGPQSKEQLHWLQGFALARQIWQLLRGEWVPVLPVKRQVGYQRDGYQREGLDFEYELASADANREEVR